MHEPFDDDDRELHETFERFATTRDPRVREDLVDRTLWLATRGARRFAGRGEPFDDLVQVARLGLLKAIDRFDPALGVHFAAYATPTIMGELRRHFRDYTWSVHVPRRAKDLRAAVNDRVDQLTKELGRAPTVDEIAAPLEVSPELVIEALEANGVYRSYSLDPQSPAHSGRVDDAELERVLDMDLVGQLLGRLEPRERVILYLRFYEQMSQSQIAAKVGASQVHVGRLIAAGLEQMRALIADDESAAASATSPRTFGADREGVADEHSQK